MGPLFDRYVVVDWSARNTPATGADSIWIAELAQAGVELSNPPTRRAALGQLYEILDGSGNERVLIGVDASLGYPVGTAQLLGLTGVPWESTWCLVAELSEDDDHNRNNRFRVGAELNRMIGHASGPFWGCPASGASRHLAPTKPRNSEIAEFRFTEQHLRRQGLRPASAWQLSGAGSVGSQTLTLLPFLQEMRRRLGSRLAVWPFTTGLAVPSLDGGAVVVAEVWPTMFAVGETGPTVKDAAQVRSTALELQSADRRDDLGNWFVPAVPDALATGVVSEEGWILGAPVHAQSR